MNTQGMPQYGEIITGMAGDIQEEQISRCWSSGSFAESWYWPFVYFCPGHNFLQYVSVKKVSLFSCFGLYRFYSPSSKRVGIRSDAHTMVKYWNQNGMVAVFGVQCQKKDCNCMTVHSFYCLLEAGVCRTSPLHLIQSKKKMLRLLITLLKIW